MDQQLSDARLRIIQLTAEVQSSKHATEQHEEWADNLQAQVTGIALFVCQYMSSTLHD